MLTDRQNQILAASIELIAKKGIQGFTIKNLSKSVGISEPAIYRHFSSKTEILTFILDNFKEMSKMLSSTIVTDNDRSAIEKVEFMFSKMFEIFSEQPAFISVIFSEEIFKNEEILKNKIVEIFNVHQTNIEKIIEIGQSNNDTRNDIDKKNLALILMGALRLLVKRWELNNQNFNLKSEGKKLIHSFKLLIVK